MRKHTQHLCLSGTTYYALNFPLSPTCTASYGALRWAVGGNFGLKLHELCTAEEHQSMHALEHYRNMYANTNVYAHTLAR